MSKSTLIALWSFVGVFALVCVLFLIWHSHSSHQAKLTAANERISQAIASANDWLGGNSSLDGEAIQQTLADALNNQVATKKGDGESVLSRVRQRLEQFVEQARIEQAQRQATAIWNDAKQQIDGKRIDWAITLLRKYVTEPHAAEKAAAQRLLAEAETAVSEMQTLDALIAMTSEDFEQLKTTGEIRDGKVTHPVLVAVRNESVQRNLDKAVQRREEIRLAEAERREAERLAAIERQRQEEERRQQEAARRAEEKRSRAERERPRDGTELFTQITTFPERYVGNNFYIRGQLFPGYTRRNMDFKCFSIRFFSKALVDGGPDRDRLSFITTEEMGAALVEMKGDRYYTTVYVKLQYLDPDKKEHPVGYVTKIEFSELDFDDVKEYKAVTLYDTGRIETHPNPFKR